MRPKSMYLKMGNFGEYNHYFSLMYLLSSERYDSDSFPEHLDLALASNKRSEEIEKQ